MFRKGEHVYIQARELRKGSGTRNAAIRHRQSPLCIRISCSWRLGSSGSTFGGSQGGEHNHLEGQNVNISVCIEQKDVLGG